MPPRDRNTPPAPIARLPAPSNRLKGTGRNSSPGPRGRPGKAASADSRHTPARSAAMAHDALDMRAPVSLERKVRFLSRPQSYAGASETVVARETHMSWVFLAGPRVYKLKKPVRFPYLDFSTLDRRADACRAEDRLNRRLAPDVYLGVVPLVEGASGLAIGGAGRVVDWLVVMRRLDDGGFLQSALSAHAVQPSQLDRLAAVLASFYAHASPLSVRGSADALRMSWRKALSRNRRVLQDLRFHLPRGMVARVDGIQTRFLNRRFGVILARARAGRIVDAHGDLRPEHIWLDGRVSIIDRLEFDPALRALDPLDEIAFLQLECTRLGAAWAGERIGRHLRSALHGRHVGGLPLFYRSYRAMLRARLAIMHLCDTRPRTPEKWPRQARAYLRLALFDALKLDRLENAALPAP